MTYKMTTLAAIKERPILFNPEKRRAHSLLANAVKNGVIKKQPCEVCGSTKSEAHHDDYSKPLEVRWFCHRHHGNLHRLEIPA